MPDKRLNYVEGYVWALVCAVGFGSSPLLIRFGLGDGGVAESLAGGLASYIVAAVVIAFAIIAIPRNFVHVRSLDGKTAGWFASAGLLVFVSQMLLYMALALAPVSVVATVQRTSLVFRVVFSWLLNREHEVLGMSVSAGIALSTLGVMAVTINVDLLVELVPMPGRIADILRFSVP